MVWLQAGSVCLVSKAIHGWLLLCSFFLALPQAHNPPPPHTHTHTHTPLPADSHCAVCVRNRRGSCNIEAPHSKAGSLQGLVHIVGRTHSTLSEHQHQQRPARVLHKHSLSPRRCTAHEGVRRGSMLQPQAITYGASTFKTQTCGHEVLRRAMRWGMKGKGACNSEQGPNHPWTSTSRTHISQHGNSHHPAP